MEQQKQIELLGGKVFTQMRGEKPGMFNKDYWQGRIMDWVMQDPCFKVDMFRFVDVLPQLETSEQVSRHVREYLLREGRPFFVLGRVGVVLTREFAERAFDFCLGCGLGDSECLVVIAELR